MIEIKGTILRINTKRKNKVVLSISPENQVGLNQILCLLDYDFFNSPKAKDLKIGNTFTMQVGDL